MKRIEELTLLINQKLEFLDSDSALKASYHEETKTISIGDVTNGRVLHIPIENGHYLSFSILHKFEIKQLLSLFIEEDQKRIEQAIEFQETSFLFC
ncbi:hypothetical protein [Lachnoclostridium phytofermentans]|uniref:Uncharacterized protein n=1 Tax=Lachnoclostridium phytofermentans (strain ATCC 700394 / DSM 18823 / ISDg) TaxID=357809 RepID=A9KLA0_LACP7|nr:hypothetical protein [Lachnoclostridium phytofermentans]ABX44249.1 hypothetical protein Cphy_3902 [Lachnoclostridium phytofermentans ISDg]